MDSNHISSHEMPNVCLFDLSPRSEEYNDWLTAEAKGKERLSGEGGERLIEWKAIIRLILYFWWEATLEIGIARPGSDR